MHSRRGTLLAVLLIFGLIVSDVAVALPLLVTSSVAAASPQPVPVVASATALKRKRSRVKKDRRQDRRQDQARQRKHDRQQTDRQRDRKHPNRPNRTQQRGSARELVGGRLPAAATVAGAAHAPVSVEDRYIVVLNPSTASVRAVAQDFAASGRQITPTHVYEHVFDGFAAVIPDDQVDDVRSDPRVQAVVPDEIVTIAAQTLPTGIRRINADKNPTAKIDGSNDPMNIDVAVVDTAGDDDHPDLNIWAWYNCTDAGDADDHGHGTHVGGTIGAIDNGNGVVGVAPGARLWNFRVLKAVPGGGSSGTLAWIICGVDLVTQYATDQGDGFGDIEVANASLGGGGFDNACTPVNAYHFAFCSAVAAGVTFVVAAGNEAVDASTKVPAAFDEVITVSALADSNGLPGGGGPGTWAGPDDTFADFSNFGADVDIAAPGVDIRSTVPTGGCVLCDASGYGLSSGTSMAAPHVAGAAALLLVEHPSWTPGQVKAELIRTRQQIAIPGDPDGINEGVLQAAAAPPVDTQDPAVQWVAPVGNGQQFDVNAGTVQFQANATDNVGIKEVEFWIREPGQDWLLFRVDAAAPYTASRLVENLPMGVSEFSADAYDAAGNWSTESIFINRTEQSVSPPPPPPPAVVPADTHKKKKKKKRKKKR